MRKKIEEQRERILIHIHVEIYRQVQQLLKIIAIFKFRIQSKDNHGICMNIKI